MLSMLTFGHLGAAVEGPNDLDPGILSLFARMARSLREARLGAHERSVATFIESSGGQLSDDIERRIGTGMATGRF